MDKHITAPITKETARSLHAGDYVYVTGTIYTARDAAHKRMDEALDRGESLPIDIKDQAIYYMGPSPAREGRPIGSAGPTTASRMDKYAPRLLDLGQTAMIGKGKRSQAVIDAVVRNGCVYLAAIGGAGALLSKCIKSSEVIAYEDTIRKYAKEYDIEDYVTLLQAIMMQESGGKGNDPMQASESGYNTKYPRVPNGITNPEYSIEVGTHNFSDCLKKAKVKDSSDTERIYLALQGYNYGSGYIEWAIRNFGGYSKYNAQQFSDNKKQELNVSGYGDPSYVDHVMRYVGITFRGGTNPNFNNVEAWVTRNPYAQAGLYGQCTWFAWGRFYELYGYDPGFSGDGSSCVKELVSAHPDKFERSSSPKAGAVFSAIGHNHVGIVIAVKDNTITVQEGNLDGITNTFQDAKKDWQTKSYTLDQLRSIYGGVVFGNPK